MITDALKLIDALLGWAKLGVESKRKAFEDHVKPIYEMLEAINQDYMVTLAAAEKKLAEEGEVVFPGAVDLIIERQRQMQAVKDKFVALVKSYVSAEDHAFPKSAKPFFESCLQYFQIGTAFKISAARNYDSWYSHMMGEDMARLAEVSDHSEAIAHFRNEISNRWQSVSFEYGKVKIALT